MAAARDAASLTAPGAWLARLKAAAAAVEVPSQEEVDDVVEDKLCEVMRQRVAREEQAHDSFRVIPRFFFKPAATPVATDFAKAARHRFLRRKTEELLHEDDLKLLAELLTENVTRAAATDESERINYEAFCVVREEMPPKAARYFAPSVFVRFERDQYDRISTQAFFQFVCGHVTLAQTRVALSLYDVTASGSLREQDLENYIFNLIPDLPPLRTLQENFYPFYVFTAVRKFIFFLDPKRTGRISIKNLVSSKILSELLELRRQGWVEEENRRNWFSGSNALRVYSQYLELDGDHNGMLNRQELARYNMGTLTAAFVDRIFQECHTYSGEMDYKTFLDFVLAVENRNTSQSIRYFFRLLDIEKTGRLSAFTINYFFREVVRRMAQAGQDAVDPADVRDEIFDMVHPADPRFITLRDLLKCRVGHTVFSMLTDVNGFWAYDNRESLLQQDDDDTS
mmetsp:Transcript_19387/g.68635  ORF Transcript_19387/g.68635 Transcript_19387/m.68635 type:complete len:455 (-) Transcript_19387:184-1548(-)